MSMTTTKCTDRVVGAILASWRYDISGISPEMRKDYEQHFAECARCRARQKFHRSLDGTLAIHTSLSALFFLFALAVLKHIKPLEHVAFTTFGLAASSTSSLAPKRKTSYPAVPRQPKITVGGSHCAIASWIRVTRLIRVVVSAIDLDDDTGTCRKQ